MIRGLGGAGPKISLDWTPRPIPYRMATDMTEADFSARSGAAPARSPWWSTSGPTGRPLAALTPRWSAPPRHGEQDRSGQGGHGRDPGLSRQFEMSRASRREGVQKRAGVTSRGRPAPRDGRALSWTSCSPRQGGRRLVSEGDERHCGARSSWSPAADAATRLARMQIERGELGCAWAVQGVSGVRRQRASPPPGRAAARPRGRPARRRRRCAALGRRRGRIRGALIKRASGAAEDGEPARRLSAEGDVDLSERRADDALVREYRRELPRPFTKRGSGVRLTASSRRAGSVGRCCVRPCPRCRWAASIPSRRSRTRSPPCS